MTPRSATRTARLNRCHQRVEGDQPHRSRHRVATAMRKVIFPRGRLVANLRYRISVSRLIERRSTTAALKRAQPLPGGHCLPAQEHKPRSQHFSLTREGPCSRLTRLASTRNLNASAVA